MSFESGARFGGEHAGNGGLPAPADIQMEDCTLVLIAVNKRLGDAETQLNDRIISQETGSTTYDCKACFAKLTNAGFENIDGEFRCRSGWRDGSRELIRGE